MNIDQLTTTQLAILTLLRAKDKDNGLYAPIPGLTHLVKELFAVKMTPLGDDLLDELKFEPDNYGPFDETVYAALEDLTSSDFIKLESTKSGTIIKLTRKGRELSDQIWGSLKDDVIGLISFVKLNFNHLSSEKLLEKIYSAYPEMTVHSKSKVALKYRH
jgi:DNA-binding PadR family transcriptional regulator